MSCLHWLGIGWRVIDIHGWYPPVNINFAPISTWKNNWWVLRLNTSAFHVRVVTDQLMMFCDGVPILDWKDGSWRSIIAFFWVPVFRAWHHGAENGFNEPLCDKKDSFLVAILKCSYWTLVSNGLILSGHQNDLPLGAKLVSSWMGSQWTYLLSIGLILSYLPESQWFCWLLAIGPRLIELS